MRTPAKRLTLMPIAPIAEHTSFFEAGAVTIGVEYRLLTDEIVNQHMDTQNTHIDLGPDIDDRGVSLHVYTNDGNGASSERLRFDCFDEDPHYHYVDWDAGTNDIVQLDTVASGDSLAWALECIRTRLTQMLGRAGVEDTASVDSTALEGILPRVTECAYRVRYHNDDGATLQGALGSP